MTAILDMNAILPTPGVFGEEKKGVGTVEFAQGKFGKAWRFDTIEGAIGGCFSAPLAAGPEWDQAAGLSFWVKGNGADDWGSIGLAVSDAVEADCIYEFPLHSTEWRKIEVPWGDFMPFMPSAGFIGEEGWRPSQLRELRFGRQLWTTVYDNPAQSFCIAQMQLEPAIPLDSTDYTPTGEPLARCGRSCASAARSSWSRLADSLTSRWHWANRSLCWVDLASHRLRKHAFSEVGVLNTTVGGHQFTHGLTQMVRWLPRCPAPDLVTVFFGGNERSNGMRAPQFKDGLRRGVDRIRRLTRGKAEILLMTTVPALTSWDGEIREMAEAVREVAAEKKTACADTEKAFRQVGQDEEKRKALFAWDEVHLGEFGHQVVADVVFEAVVGGVPEMEA